MKEIKAYIKITSLENVVAGLKNAGLCCMSIIDVSGLGPLMDPSQAKYSFEFVQKMSKVAKLELVCKDDDANRVVSVIQKYGCTNQPGDGIIFVSPVERAVKIRSGQEGDTILQVPSTSGQ